MEATKCHSHNAVTTAANSQAVRNTHTSQSKCLKTGVHKSGVPGCPGNYILYVILSMELTSCHPSGTYNSGAASRFLENL
jgi:hypothetical protein